MSIQQLLQQVLQSGQSLTQEASSKFNTRSAGNSALGGFGGGALAGGALGLLLGNKKFRKMGGKLATYGGAAALGALALKTYQDWQNNKATASSGAPVQPEVNVTPAATTPVPALPPAQLEEHSRIILAAMIAAAKADGHIGAEERQLLDAEIARLSSHPADLEWFHAELTKPADPAQAAALARTPEMAAEVYLASVLVADEQSFMERAYLDELARQLSLEPGLKLELESKVKALNASAV